MMEKREGYKKTKIGWVPDDWECVNLGDVAAIKGRIGWKGLKKDEYTEAGPYLIAGKHIKYGRINWEVCDHISRDRYEESMEIALKEGDTILTKDGSIGNPAFVDQLPGEATINSTMLLIRANNIFHPKFVFFQFQGAGFNRLVREKLSGSSIPHIFQRDMVNYSIPLPPLPEQKKIASILTTVDDKISSIDQQIQQTEQLKKGLMEKLLTEGIGHTEFKETKIGRIPKGWSVVSVGKIVEKIIGGGTPSRERPDYYNGTIPWITVKDLSDSSFYKNSAIETISEEGLKDSSANLIVSDSVIISTRMGLGRGFINTVAMAINQDMKALYLKRDNISNTFFLYWYFSKSAFIEALGTGTTVKGISLTTLKNLALPFPSLKEQKQIATILSTVDDKIEVLNQKKSHYQTLKKGLSQQLLTGQMRVKI